MARQKDAGAATDAFDAVAMMRQIRDRLSREIKGMSAEEVVEYFRRKVPMSSATAKQGRGGRRA
ncbi:hypothetical protein FJY63_07590 [Candidatus Sumerlaeota bacterium]|nr:hypothetical protein [Candidatus Sumerlaeota bacterium]